MLEILTKAITILLNEKTLLLEGIRDFIDKEVLLFNIL